ncbi:MAG: sigma-54-dependent Fis family transcriptional regulator, partial [Nitrospinae bacterium]|nr:sigma-54-dependent Fis family transcriptional regulator [Nitrospinota bacterium]
MGATENDANGLALVVDDDKISLMLIRTYLSEWGIRVRVADNAEEALNVLENEPVVDIVFMDQRLPRMQGLEALEVIKGRFPHTQVVMLTAFGNISSAVRAIKGGACDYLNKPVERDQLELVTQRALKVARLERENEVLRARGADTGGFSAIVCQTGVMKTALERSRNLAVMDLTILITGESGTGKELLARGIHDASRRHQGPFIAINCAALPEDLLSSALFGYEKGAFTGAAGATKGCFEEADGGTLFLDEISEMSPKLQSSVLRALQEREFYRLGSYKPVKSDFRLVCATNKNLEAKVRAGHFRQDLFYRINVATIDLP